MSGGDLIEQLAEVSERHKDASLIFCPLTSKHMLIYSKQKSMLQQSPSFDRLGGAHSSTMALNTTKSNNRNSGMSLNESNVETYQSGQTLAKWFEQVTAAQKDLSEDKATVQSLAELGTKESVSYQAYLTQRESRLGKSKTPPILRHHLVHFTHAVLHQPLPQTLPSRSPIGDGDTPTKLPMRSVLFITHDKVSQQAPHLSVAIRPFADLFIRQTLLETTGANICTALSIPPNLTKEHSNVAYGYLAAMSILNSLTQFIPLSESMSVSGASRSESSVSGFPGGIIVDLIVGESASKDHFLQLDAMRIKPVGSLKRLGCDGTGLWKILHILAVLVVHGNANSYVWRHLRTGIHKKDIVNLVSESQYIYPPGTVIHDGGWFKRGPAVAAGPQWTSVEDASNQWEEWIRSLSVLGLSQSEIDYACKTLLAILVMGAARSEKRTFGSQNSAVKMNDTALRCVELLLGMDSDNVEGENEKSDQNSAALLSKNKENTRLKRVLIQRTANLRNGLLYTTFLDAENVRRNRDSFARCVYSLLVDWLVQRANTSLAQLIAKNPDGGSPSPSIVRVWDAPGLDAPSFGADPRGSATFDHFMNNYAAEKIRGSLGAWKDGNNSMQTSQELCQALVEGKKSSLAAVMDNTRRRERLNALSWAKNARIELEILQEWAGEQRGSQTVHMLPPDEELKKQDSQPSEKAFVFTIKHYAEEVSYNFRSGRFMESNRTQGFVEPDVLHYFRTGQSENKVIQDIFGPQFVHCVFSNRENNAIRSVRQRSSMPEHQQVMMMQGGVSEDGKLKLAGGSLGMFHDLMDELTKEVEESDRHVVYAVGGNQSETKRQFESWDLSSLVQQHRSEQEMLKASDPSDYTLVFMNLVEFVRRFEILAPNMRKADSYLTGIVDRFSLVRGRDYHIIGAENIALHYNVLSFLEEFRRKSVAKESAQRRPRSASLAYFSRKYFEPSPKRLMSLLQRRRHTNLASPVLI